MHDLGSAKVSPKFKELTYTDFKGDLISEFRKLTGVHKVTGFAGAGTTGKSYETYETLIQKKILVIWKKFQRYLKLSVIFLNTYMQLNMVHL